MIVIDSATGAFIGDESITEFNAVLDQARLTFQGNNWTWSGKVPTADDVTYRMLSLMEYARERAVVDSDGYGVVMGGRLRAEVRIPAGETSAAVTFSICYQLG